MFQIAQGAGTSHTGGEINLILPDLGQATFLGGISGSSLLMWGLGVAALGLVFGLMIYHKLRNMPVHSSMKEISEYFARLLSWYTKGGFTDEYGKRWESGHHYKVAYWEVLNEIDFEHHWTPEQYTKFYDAVTTAMRKVDPDIKFMALALAHPSESPEMFEYFLNPANHKKGWSTGLATPF